jgi:ATP-dependent DNA ligase
VTHRQLTSHADLDAMEAEIVANGGEGCVIRRPGSNYRPGRMGDVIKVKRLVSDLDRPI